MKHPGEPLLSIVMPVYNEEDCLESVVRDMHDVILSRLSGSELLVVNDGSTDATPKILEELSRSMPQVVPLHKENGGHGHAVLHGLDRARGKYIFLTDSDGQTDPRDFWSLWEKRDGAEFLCGVRAQRHDPLHRLVIARLLRYGLRGLFGVQCRDANVPFKLMTRDFWESIREWVPPDTLTPSIFLTVAAKRRLHTVPEIEIRHLARATGSCTIRYLKLLRFCIRAFFQLLSFRRRFGRSGSGASDGVRP